MSEILFIVPSRGRPHNARKLQEAFYNNGGECAQLLIAIDEDDPSREEYENLRRNALRVEVGPRLRLGGTLNSLAMKYASSYQYIGFMGDDHWPRTEDWDIKFYQALEDYAVVYGNDLRHGEGLPTQVAMHSEIITKLGYMCPPGLVHFYLDNFWLEVGRYLNSIKYLPDVIIEHMHHDIGKSTFDAGYADVNNFYYSDEAIYHEYMRTQFRNDMRAL